MIGLTIDGVQVNFKQDTNFEYYKENPFFTKSGDYTYDIDIDLNDPVNQIVYKHIDRFHSFNKPTGRKACLFDGGRIICYGTEIILKKEENILKIQIVSGNSELNYFYAGDQKIRELDFGTIPQPRPEYAASIANRRYPEVNYVFPPLLKSEDGNHSDSEFYNNINNFNVGSLQYDPNTKFYPQPFLLYYIEKIVEIVGYKVTYNCLLEEERWRRLIIVNGYDSLEFAKLLPDWTANEFITYCEKFFNVIFLVYSISNEVHIIPSKKYYNDLTPIVLTKSEIIEDFNRDYETDGSELYLDYNNVEYALPSSTGYKYASINSTVLDKCTIRKARMGDLWNVEDANWANNYIIYYDEYIDLYFIRTGSVHNFRQVMQLQPSVKDESGDMVTLKIVPSEIHVERKKMVGSMTIPFDVFSFSPIPDYYANQNPSNFNDAIVNGVSDTASDIMKVAFYTGMVGLRHEAGQAYNHASVYEMPMCICTKWQMLTLNPNGLFYIEPKEMVGNPQNMTLSLCGIDGRATVDFDNNLIVDTSQEHIIQIITNQNLSPTSIYIIDNRRFYCKSLKYTVENGVRSNIVEGRFFPVL